MTVESVSLSLEDLQNLAERLRSSDVEQRGDVPSIRKTTFSLGSDPRLLFQQVSAPNFYLVEILRDQLKQPFLRLNWRVQRYDVDSGKIAGFNVYRKRIPQENLDEDVYSAHEFDKLFPGATRTGRFSEEKKGIDRVRKGHLGEDVLNRNLDREQRSSNANRDSNIDLLDRADRNVDFTTELVEQEPRVFEKLLFVEYTKFIAAAKERTVFVEDVKFVDIFFEDRNVAYGEQYEYYVTSVSTNLEETYQSDIVFVEVVDNTSISSPVLTIKALTENQALLKVCYEKRDAINRIHVFKKDDVVGIEFKKIVELRDVPNECAEVLDESLVYGRQYTYRVFVENIHGMISAPTEITLFAVVNKILAKSRYNSLKNPIFNAQTQKGKASITINANDKRILYYTIERRDITIGEKKFIVPTLETNKYGGKGWSFNSLFVNGQQTIRFVDDTTTNDHVYEYKIIGVDAYGNKSSDSRMLVKVEQGVLRAPINALVIVDRERPLSLKISWEDDNGLSNSPGAVLNTSEQSPNARPRPRTRTATEVEKLVKSRGSHFLLQ